MSFVSLWWEAFSRCLQCVKVPDPVPIADYAAIGCTRSVALVSRGGSIDWLCWPRFDSPSIFGRLLDIDKGGFFAIHPAVEHESKRRYLDGTNVIETTFTSGSGTARLIDLMPVMTEEEKRTTLTPFRQLLRRIEVIEGELPIEIIYAPRPDYARITPRLQHRGDSIHCGWGACVLNLRSDAKFEIEEQESNDARRNEAAPRLVRSPDPALFFSWRLRRDKLPRLVAQAWFSVRELQDLFGCRRSNA